MAKRSKAGTATAKALAPTPLPGDLALDFDAFCAAHYKAEKAEVIRRALRFFIDSRLAAEPEMRARFIEERTLLTKDRAAVVPFRAQNTSNPDETRDRKPSE
jgi:hypothetical protein